MTIWKNLTLVSVSFWLGGMVFFSVFVTPAAFSVLDRAGAGKLVTEIFPHYYFFGMVMGTLALAGVAGRFVGSAGKTIPWGSLVLLVLMLGLCALSLFVLLPKLQALRQAMPGPSLGFARLHRLSVALNLITMLAGLTLLFMEGLRSRP